MSSRFLATALTALGAAALSTAAEAAVIGVNFTGNENNAGSTLGPTEVAGLVPQDDWNNIVGQDPFAGTPLKDDSGANAATLSFARTAGYANQWHTAADTSTTNGQLYRGLLKTADPAGQASMVFTFSNVAAGVYDLYAYTANNETSKSTAVDVSATSAAGTATYYISEGDISGTPTFTRGTATTAAGRSAATYVLFEDVSPNVNGQLTLSLTIPGGAVGGATSQMGIAGIQLDAVPEPAGLSLLGLGAGALLARRRRS